jgi:acyl-CoA synthetase (NDP forming)
VRTALESLLEPRSVAVVGASAREGSVGHQTLVELIEGGFDGSIFPVNPKYGEILGLRCLPSLADIGSPVDLAILAVGNALLEDQMRLAAGSGARSTVIFASCYEAPRDDAPPLTERLGRIARDAGMAVCGGNCMGFANIEKGVRAVGFYEPKGLRPGQIAFVSHSGSAFSALLHNDRGLSFNLAVSSGHEIATTAAEYVRYALALETTRVVGLFVEVVRDPDAFVAALQAANEKDVPVVAMKVGREALTRRMVTAHSGALAGEDGAYEALFDAYGVVRVESLDEMGDALALLSMGRRAGPGGLASVHDSGGERALLVDAAAATRVPLARISERTTKRLADLLEEGLLPVNPLDFWGTGRDSHRVVTGCMRALLEDPDTAALAFGVDLTTEDQPDMGYIAMAREVFPETAKPFAMLSNFAPGIDRSDAKQLQGAGIPVLEGTLTGLAAFRHLFDYRDFRDLPAVAGRRSPAETDVRDRWRARLATGERLDELEGLSLLAHYGIPVARGERAGDVDGAVKAAERIGWPVALKTAAPGVEHKSDVGGVRLGLMDAQAVADAYRDLASRLGPEVVVAAMAPQGVEMHLGVLRDEQFGPLVLVAAGGVLVEVLKDRRLALPPLDEARARRLIDRLASRPLLDGVRGRPAADVEALVDAIVAMSWLALDLGDHVEALDANPVIVSREGCVAVDALVLPRGRSQAQSGFSTGTVPGTQPG